MDRYEIIGQFRIIAPKQFNLDNERLLTAAADLLEADAREIEVLKSEVERLNNVIVANNLRFAGIEQRDLE